MHFRAVFPVFNFVLHRSDAFVVPNRKATAVGKFPSLSFAENLESRISGLKSQLKNEGYEISPESSRVQQQLETTLAPAIDFIDNASDGWALSYADLTPNSERTLLGQAFLATNIAYTAVGIFLSLQGEVLLGVFTDICSVASFCYHYAQLQQPYGRTNDSIVKLALLVDYLFAITSIFIGLFYLVFGHAVPPTEGIICAILSIVSLLSCWVWERGLPYLVLHSLWHLLSAASAYYIGIAHVSTI